MHYRDSRQSELMTALKQRFNATDFHNESLNGIKKMSFKVNPSVNENAVDKVINKSLNGVRNIEIDSYNGRFEVNWTERELPTDISGNFEALIDKYVPNSGKADTVAGELLRAVERIEYRWFNDGDKFYSGYGKETAGSSAEYLIKESNDEIADIIRDMVGDDDYYDECIEKLKKAVIAYLVDNPELFDTNNKIDSRNYQLDEVDELEPTEDVYIDYETIGGDQSDWNILETIGLISNELLTDYVSNCIDGTGILSELYQAEETGEGTVVYDVKETDVEPLNDSLENSWDDFLDYCNDNFKIENGFDAMNIANADDLEFVLDRMESSIEDEDDIRGAVEELEDSGLTISDNAVDELIAKYNH